MRVDSTGIAILGGIFALASIVAAVFALEWWKRKREVDRAREWPQTEATVETAALEPVTEGRYTLLPTCSFSYRVAGEIYSGRFSLVRPRTVPRESLLLQMAARKLQVHYDPEHPEIWFIPDELIEGCKVEQKMSPHVVALYPR
jgi:hypothetical protein